MAKTIVVVIDPGHGGYKTVANSGWNHATSASGVLEKHMPLALAKQTKSELAGTKGLKTILTRTTDENLGLSARIDNSKYLQEIANYASATQSQFRRLEL